MPDPPPAVPAVAPEEPVDYRIEVRQPATRPARRVLDHLPAILVAAGIVLSSATGLAYEYFYGRLGVRPSELGLGTEQILLHGALGLGFVALVVALPVAGLVVSALNLVIGRGAGSDKLSLLDWILAIVALGALLAAVAAALAGAPSVLALGSLAALAALGVVKWLSRVEAQATASSWRAAWDVGVLWYGCAISLIGGASLVLWAVDTDEDTGLAVVGGVVAVALSLVGLELGRRWIGDARGKEAQAPSARQVMHVRIDVIAGIAALAWLVAYVELSAIEDADRVADKGLAPDRFAGSLYSAPIRCTDIRWIDGRPPAGLPPQALYLGQSTGIVVLHETGRGPLRLPTAAAVLEPAPAERCAAP